MNKTNVISGLYKGRHLTLPQDDTVRPTRNMVLQAAFNIMQAHVNWAKVRVLDVCCGSGQWGIEALSRGATHATFIDKHTHYTAANTAALAIPTEKYDIIQGDITTLPLPKATLIMADPPYATPLPQWCVDYLATQESGTLLMLEHSLELSFTPPDSLGIITTKRYGHSQLTLLQKHKKNTP